MIKLFTTRSEARKCRKFLMAGGKHPKWVANAFDCRFPLRRLGWAITMRITDGLGVHHYVLRDNGRFEQYQCHGFKDATTGMSATGEGERWIAVDTERTE